jgi:4-amino-4-deoxy-L-arabinose transferase-like glycosyltransferase
MLSSSIIPRLGFRDGLARIVGQPAHSRYLDAAIVAALLLLAGALLLPACSHFPMELWDESRNANNAIEMAINGQWLITTFNGLPDHWNAKPPLLIWMMAALLQSGIPALLALRLPSMVAAMVTVTLLFLFCRVVLQDRLAGVLSALLLLASSLFIGPHVSQAGDYDALLSFFILVVVLSFGRYVDAAGLQGSRWLAISGAAFLLAALTKGVCALFVLPGLFAYLLVKRRLYWASREIRLWLIGLAILVVLASYYWGRDALDPGYLQAVWQSELGGRYLTHLEAHHRGALYYFFVLLVSFEPGFLLIPLLIRPLRSSDTPRRDVVLITTLASVSLLIVVTGAVTKLYWYVAPLVPLMSLAVGIALADALGQSKGTFSATARGSQLLRLAVIAMLGLIIAQNLNDQNVHYPIEQGQSAIGLVSAGPFIDKLRNAGVTEKLLVIASGTPNDSDSPEYHPVADFYRKIADAHDFASVAIVETGDTITAGARVLTCDPEVRPWLHAAPWFAAIQNDAQCVFGQARTASTITLATAPITEPRR